MRLVIFGGTGKTGRLLVEQALAAGHEVTVLARTPSKLGVTHARLHVVQGDALDPNKVGEAVAGANAIVSLLGPTRDGPPFSLSRSTDNIIEAAQRCGAKRLLVTAGAGVGDPRDKPGVFDKMVGTLLKTVAKGAYEDTSVMARTVKGSRLDWTLVRIPRLTDKPARGTPRVGYLGQGAGMSLSRASLAAFLLEQAGDSAYVRQAPVISD